MRENLQDDAAALVSIIVVVGVVLLSVIGRPVPDGLSSALGASMTWLFVRTAHTIGTHVLDSKETHIG